MAQARPEGQHTVYVRVIVDSELDKAIGSSGHEANGYFPEGLARYRRSAGRIDSSLQLAPEGDGIGIYGEPAHVDKAQATLTKVAESPRRNRRTYHPGRKSGHRVQRLATGESDHPAKLCRCIVNTIRVAMPQRSGLRPKETMPLHSG